jgi:hypothetical protein
MSLNFGKCYTKSRIIYIIHTLPRGAVTLSDFLLAEFLFREVLTSLSMAGCHLFSVTGLPLFYHAFITDR